MNLYYQGRQFGANSSYIDVTPGGKDSGYMNVNATRTGYYLAKFMNTVADFLKPLEEQDSRHYNPMLRKQRYGSISPRHPMKPLDRKLWDPDAPSLPTM